MSIFCAIIWRRGNVGVNRERIISLIGEIEKSLQLLKEFSRVEKDELLGDLKSLGSLKYYFITAIAACCDICNHITSKERWGVPDSYSGCFYMLKDHGIISADFTKKLVNMAKFRNLLVHFYGKIDDERIYEFLQTELEVFQTYIDVIAQQYL
jgi:uncharacterized protein YutE (UPF0331/DUF86 family)